MASETLSNGFFNGENSVSPRPENPHNKRIPVTRGVLDRALGASFFHGRKLDHREMSLLYINGGPDHVMSISHKRGIMGESVYAFATGESGPTVVSVAEKKDVRGQKELLSDQSFNEGIEGSQESDVVEALNHLEEIFPDYRLVQAVVIDSDGKKYVNGELIEGGEHVDSTIANVNTLTALTPGQDATVGQ